MVTFLILIVILRGNSGEYHFYRNTGGLFYDYSHNGFHALNGQFLEPDQKDTFITDRGAYFDGSTYITVHSDKWDYPTIPSKVKIGIWIYLLDFGGIFYRKNQITGLVLQLTVLESQNLELRLRTCDQNTHTVCELKTYQSSKFDWGLQQWYFIWIRLIPADQQYQVRKGILKENWDDIGNEFFQQSSQHFQTFLGLNSSQQYMKGFIYLLAITRSKKENFQNLDNSGCNDNCYFGLDYTYCQCNECVQNPQEICLSTEENPLLASDGSECNGCSGICRALSQCFECSQQESPVCDVLQQISYQDVCYQKCIGCTGPEQTDCVYCIDPFNKNIDTNICECPQQSIEDTLDCICEQGYVMMNKNSFFECEECQYPCSTCINTPDYCLSCSILYAYPLNGECQCSEGSVLEDEECVCQEGFYNSCIGCSIADCEECYKTCKSCSGGTKYDCFACTEPLYLTETGECVLCHQSCKTCKGSLQNECLSCFDYFVLTDEGTCQECDQSHFSKDNQCFPCKEDCFLCDSKECLKCIQEDEVSDGEGGCNVGCQEGQFEQNKKCYDCRSTCKECQSYQECFECVQFAHFLENSCECFNFYTQKEEGCVLQEVEIDLHFVQENIFIIGFDIELKFDLEEKDLDVSLSEDYDFDYKLQKINSTDYYFYLLAQQSIPQNTSLSIQLSENIQGEGGKSLSTYTLQSSLTKFDKASWFQNFIEHSTKNTSQIMIIFLAIISFIGGSPTSLWTFINTVQILSLLPLSTLYLSINTHILLVSLSNYKPFPNIFQYYFQRSGNTPYQQARNFGLQTNDFLINSGELMMILFTTLIFFVIIRFILGIKLLQSHQNLRVYLKWFANSALLMIWIQEYYQILILASIQCMHPNLENTFGILNLALSILIILIGILTPLFLTILLIKYSQEILSLNQQGFRVIFGSLFQQFKNTSILHTQYYLVFIFRRIINILALIFLLEYFWVQAFVFLVSALGQMLYVFYFRPFKNKADLFLNMIAELFTFFVHIVVLLFQWDGFIDEEYLDYCVMTFVSMIIVGNIVFPLYNVLYKYSSLFCVSKILGDQTYHRVFKTIMVN